MTNWCCGQSYQYRTGTRRTGRYIPFRSLNEINSSSFCFVFCFSWCRSISSVSPCFVWYRLVSSEMLRFKKSWCSREKTYSQTRGLELCWPLITLWKGPIGRGKEQNRSWSLSLIGGDPESEERVNFFRVFLEPVNEMDFFRVFLESINEISFRVKEEVNNSTQVATNVDKQVDKLIDWIGGLKEECKKEG